MREEDKRRPAAPARLVGAPMAHEARGGRPHPLTLEAGERLRAGRLDRRGFLRAATLLGLGLGAASRMAEAFVGPAAAQTPETAATSASAAAAPTPRPGGRLRVAMSVAPVADPALFEWVEQSNIARHQHEHLTITGADNITRPMLASGWEASDDLKTWTFRLREGVLWHDGSAFDAEDVVFNLRRWLDPRLRSSNSGLLAALTEEAEAEAEGGARLRRRRPIEGAIEAVDPLTVRLHLATPVLALPESFYNYPTMIVHRDFSGDIATERNGTGPYRIDEVTTAERAVLSRARADGWRYWGEEIGHIGPGWVDAIEYRHFLPARPEAIAALAAGEIDLVHEVGVDGVEAARATPGAVLLFADTAQTGCIRMRVDVEPFVDWRVRRAVQLSCDPRAFPDRLFAGRGRPAEHHHVAPIHPDYFRLPELGRDVAKARELLAAAGYPSGLALRLDVGNTSGVWQQRACELLAEQAAEAGLRITVNVMPPEKYQEVWRETPFGLTQWIHRPLGTMALSLAYRSDVPWNETGYANAEFDAALTEAEAKLDVIERRDAMEPVERMLQDDAVMVQPVWVPIFSLAAARVKGLAPQPTQYHAFNGVWLDA